LCFTADASGIGSELAATLGMLMKTVLNMVQDTWSHQSVKTCQLWGSCQLWGWVLYIVFI